MGLAISGTRVELELEVLAEESTAGPVWSSAALWVICPHCSGARLENLAIPTCPECSTTYAALGEPQFWLPRVQKWFPAADLPKPKNLTLRKSSLWDMLQEEKVRLEALAKELERLQAGLHSWGTGAGNPIPTVDDLARWLCAALSLGVDPLTAELLLPNVQDEIHIFQQVRITSPRTVAAHVLRRKACLINGNDPILEALTHG